MATTELTPAKKTKSELAEQLSFTPEQLQLMKNTVAKGATDDEFMLLLHLAKTYGLDPFAKEIWCIKYGNQAATIFSSRDGYLKIASRDKQMNGIQSDAVCANDTFRKLVDGSVEHLYGLPDRGALVGAWALVHRKDRAFPAYFFAPFTEYAAGNNPTWKKYPSAMIIKVAEAMALKRAFSISGLVTQEEIGLDMQLEQEPGTSAEVLPTTPVASPAPAPAATPVMTASSSAPATEAAVSSADTPLTPRTKKLTQLALDAYDANAEGKNHEQRILDSLGSMTEEAGTKTLRWLELKPKKKQHTAKKTTVAAWVEPSKADTSLVDEFKARPTASNGAPADFMTPAQKKEIERLLDIPAITRPEKTLVILNINRLDEPRAQDLITKLTKAIDEREGGAGAAIAA